MIVPTIFNGMQGTSDANVLGMIPSTGAPNDVANGTTRLNYYTLKQKFPPDCMAGSVLIPNLSGMRGVKPCAGIGRSVLRRPAISSLGGIYPHTGFARGQKKGMLYDPNVRIDGPLLPLASSFNAGILNKIPNLKG